MRSKACKPLKEGLDPGPSHTHKDPSLVQTPDLVQTMSSPDLVQTQSSPDLVKTQSSPNLVQRRDTDGTKGQEKSQKELLHLLVIMEGELQARDDVIAVLRSQRWGPDVLEAHYGSSAPLRPLQALQRDTALSRNPDDVYEAPMAELDLLQQQYSSTYRMMVEQLNSEKLKHKEFMRKSDDFTNLLEADRIRLKQLVEQEKWSQIHKDKEHVEHLGKLRSEVLQLRSLLLLLLHQLQNQRRSIRELRRNLQEREKSLSQSLDRGKHQEQVILRLETELEQEATKLFSEREDTTNQLLTQDSQMHLLQLQLTQFCSTTQDLQQKNQDLQQKNQDLQQKNQDLQQKNQDLQQKNQDLQQRNQNLTQRNQDLEQRNQNLTQKNQELQSSGHMVLTERVSAKGSPSLVQELEILRGKFSEMAEKEENLSRMESQCGELRMKLEEAQSQSSVLRKEVEEVQQRLGQTQKLRTMFLKSEAESSQLRLSLEEEKQSVKDLSAALESVRAKVKELEETEEKLEETERALREDLSKLRSLTLTMAEEHKEVKEELGRERERSEEMEERLRSERERSVEMEERLRSERERSEEIEERLRSEKERSEEMEERLRSERERREEMEERLRSERKRSEEMEERLRQEQENVSEVTEKMEEESKRWMKVKSELEQSAEEERRKLKSSFQLEGHVARSEMSLWGKGQMWEEPSPEMRTLKSREKVSQLDSRCKEAESELQTLFRAEKKKNEELRAETLTLKEQIHQLRTTEDHRLCQLQMELQEVKRRQQTEEVPHMDNLRRFSRVSGQRLVPVSSSSSQTENFDDDSTDGFIRRCVQEENSFMTSLQQQGHTSLRQQGHKPVLERYPLARTLPPPLQTHQPHAPLRIRFSPSLSSCSTLEFTGVSDRLRACPTRVCPTRVCMVPQSSSSHRFSSSTSSTSSSSTSSSAVTIAAVSKAQKGQLNVIRVEDSTIHIRLGAPLTQRSEEVTEKSSTKKSSSIMITPTNGNARKGGFGLCSSPGPCPVPGPVWSKPVQSLSALGLCSITRVHESKAEHLKIQMKTSNL
ncbi:unnamed protein product [Knipowitschia caucasica]